MRNTIALLVVLFSGVVGYAAPVTVEQVGEMVAGWQQVSAEPLEQSLAQQIESIVPVHDAKSNLLYYVVNLVPEGYVLTSADDAINPIIAFSPHGRYLVDDANPLATLIESDMSGRLQRVQRQTTTKAATAEGEVAAGPWQWLRDAGKRTGYTVKGIANVDDVRVPPLLETRWNQSTVGWPRVACYNYYSPPYAAGSTSNYVAGCTQTAWAQIMRYFEWPKSSIGVITNTIHVDGVAEQRTTRGNPYSWQNMPHQPDASTPENQRQAIGALLYDLGVVNGARYSAGGTSAGMSVYDLISIFGYTDAAYTSPGYTTLSNCLTAAINANLDAGLVVQLSLSREGGGHAVVGDGYGYHLGSLYHHLNLGWGGSADAWYQMPDVDTGLYNYDTLSGVIYNVFTNGTGEIVSGRVVDAAGAPIDAAEVTIAGEGMTNTVFSDARGIFAFTAVPASGSYALTAASGSLIFADVQVSTGDSPRYGAPGNCWGVELVGGVAVYTITFDSAGGSSVPPITQVDGSAVTAPTAPTRAGYTFSGWNPSVPATMPAEDRTVIAQWTVNSYTLTFNSAGGSVVSPITQSYATSVTAPTDPIRDGYTFNGWIPALPATMPAGDLTLTAQWTLKPYPTDDVVLENRRPVFIWPAVTGATWYQLGVRRNGSAYFSGWIDGVTSWTAPVNGLPGGDYQWWFRAWGPEIGYGEWTGPASFSVEARTPGELSLIDPDGSQANRDLTFRWNQDVNATWYRLWVGHPDGGTWYNHWYGLSGTGEGSASVSNHPGGTSTWWMRAWGPDGYGPWSGPMEFSTPDPAPAVPTLVAPTGSVSSSVTFEYQSERAEWFRIYVAGDGGKVIDQWTEDTTHGPVDFAAGDYRWWVGAWNAVSDAVEWSAQGLFRVD